MAQIYPASGLMDKFDALTGWTQSNSGGNSIASDPTRGVKRSGEATPNGVIFNHVNVNNSRMNRSITLGGAQDTLYASWFVYIPSITDDRSSTIVDFRTSGDTYRHALGFVTTISLRGKGYACRLITKVAGTEVLISQNNAKNFAFDTLYEWEVLITGLKSANCVATWYVNGKLFEASPSKDWSGGGGTTIDDVRLGIVYDNTAGSYSVIIDDLHIADSAPASIPHFAHPCYITVTRNGTTGAKIGMLTNRAVTATLNWGTASPPATSAGASTVSGNYHEWMLTGLSEGTTYYYQATLTNPDEAGDLPQTKIGSFSFPAATTDTKVLVLGDSQGPYVGCAGGVNAINDINLILHAGDVTDITGDASDTDAIAQKWMDMCVGRLAPALLKAPAAFVDGNHDWTLQDGVYTPNRFLGYLPRPKDADVSLGRWYSFDLGRAHYIITTLESAGFNADCLTWVEADLAASDAQWKIMVNHGQVYYASVATEYKNPPGVGPGVFSNRAEIHTILKNGGLNLYIGGHQHRYNKVCDDGVFYLTVPESNVVSQATWLSFPNIVDGTFSPKAGSIAASGIVPGYCTLHVEENSIRGEMRDYAGALYDSFNVRQRAGGPSTGRAAR